MGLETENRGLRSEVNWVSVDVDIPDAEIAVLICLSDGCVDVGYVGDEDLWRYGPGVIIEEVEVLYWAEFPEGPGHE